MLSAWVTLHVTRGVLNFHKNDALKTMEYKEVREMSAGDFIEQQNNLALDYHYGSMEEAGTDTGKEDFPDESEVTVTRNLPIEANEAQFKEYVHVIKDENEKISSSVKPDT